MSEYNLPHEGYVYRFYCGQCKATSGWFDHPDEASAAGDEHEASHDDLYYPTDIQRYPEDDPLVVRTRD